MKALEAAVVVALVVEGTDVDILLDAVGETASNVVEVWVDVETPSVKLLAEVATTVEKDPEVEVGRVKEVPLDSK